MSNIIIQLYNAGFMMTQRELFQNGCQCKQRQLNLIFNHVRLQNELLAVHRDIKSREILPSISLNIFIN